MALMLVLVMFIGVFVLSMFGVVAAIRRKDLYMSVTFGTTAALLIPLIAIFGMALVS